MRLIQRRWSGLVRRCFRAGLQSKIKFGHINRTPGSARLSGYGFGMVFPDRLIWANQILQIFGEDCYGVHQLPENCTVIDAGANIGTFSMYVKWVRPAAKIIAIEPSIENMKYLKANLLRLSTITNDVEIISSALGATTGSVSLTGAVSDSLRTGNSGESVVAVKTLHEIVSGQTIDLLKMDIEGAEGQVLKAASGHLGTVKRVVIEYHRYRYHSDSLGEIICALEEDGFDRFRIYAEGAYDWPDDALPNYCCHLEARRAS
jgi:FkbM family methyltransferase